MFPDKELDVFVSKGQENKLRKNQAFQAKHTQFSEPDEKNSNHVRIAVGHKHYKKIANNVAKGKGIRIIPEMVKGCGFFGKVGDFVKKNIKQDDVKKLGAKAISFAGKKLGVSDEHLAHAHNLLDEATDNFYAGNKKLVSGNTVKKVANHAINHAVDKYANGNEMIKGVASNLGNKIIDDKYGEGFVKGTAAAKAHAKMMRDKFLQKNCRHHQDDDDEPAPASKGRRFAKGSKEAKEHMARIRAMRGKGFFGDMLKSGVQVAKNLASNPTVQQKVAGVASKLLQKTPVGQMLGQDTTNNLVNKAVSVAGNKIAGSGIVKRGKGFNFKKIIHAVASNPVAKQIATKAITTAIQASPVAPLLNSTLGPNATNQLASQAVNAGFQATSNSTQGSGFYRARNGTGVYRRTRNNCHPVVGGMVSAIYSNARVVRPVAGGSFRSLNGD
jgi:hypothetical protein